MQPSLTKSHDETDHLIRFEKSAYSSVHQEGEQNDLGKCENHQTNLLCSHEEGNTSNCERATEAVKAANQRLPQELSSELYELAKLAFPVFLSSVSWVVMKTTDTALLGHVSKDGNKSYYLSVSSYADLWMSTTSIIIQGQVLNILAAPCIESGRPELVGVWLQISYTCLFIICIPVVICFLKTEEVLLACGVAADMAHDAQYYANVFIAALPARILASQLGQYLSCQKVLLPSTIAAAIGMLFNLALGLYLVLGIPSFPSSWNHAFGFVACPWITVVVEWIQPAVVMFLITKGGMKENGLKTWPQNGWAGGRHITIKRCKEFLKYYCPSAASIASDFLRFSVIGAIAASQSPLNLAVFNSSYRILWMCLVFSGALASAICIQVGMALGGKRVSDAQYSIRVGLSLCICTLLGLSAVIVAIPTELAELFSNDPLLWSEFHKIRWPLAFTMMTMNFSVALERVVMNLGFTDLAFYAGLVGSWAGQVPFVVAFTHFFGNSMYWLYMGVASGYTLLCLLLSYFLFNVDWEFVIRLAMERSETHPAVNTADKSILSSGSLREEESDMM